VGKKVFEELLGGCMLGGGTKRRTVKQIGLK